MRRRKNHVLMIAPYPREGASVRYRLLQFVPLLEENGISVTFRPFMNPAFFRMRRRFGLYALPKAALFVWATLKRVGDLRRARREAAVVIHREAYPIGPPIFEKLLRRMNGHIVYDFDDADFAALPNPIDQRRLFRDSQKLDKILALSSRIIAGNAFLAEYARRCNAAVTVIPTVVDIDSVRPRTAPDRDRVVIGWIGNWGNAHYLNGLQKVFEELAAKHPLTLKLIGGEDIFKIRFRGVEIEPVRWSLAGENEDLAGVDIGIMPLGDSPYDVGKCGFKIIQYFLHGLPVVASPVGVNCEIIEPGKNGFLASTDQEWVESLGRLIADADLRRRLGREGRRLVEGRYSIQAVGPAFLEVIMAALTNDQAS